MSKKGLKISILILALFFMLANTAVAKEVTLKGVSSFAEGTRYSKNFERFVEKVNKEGKGLVQINYIGGGGKVMSPFEVGNAVRGGVVDVCVCIDKVLVKLIVIYRGTSRTLHASGCDPADALPSETDDRHGVTRALTLVREPSAGGL